MEKPNTPEEALRARAQAEYDKLKAQAAERAATARSKAPRQDGSATREQAESDPSDAAESKYGESPGARESSAAEYSPKHYASDEARTSIDSLVNSLSSQLSALVRDEFDYTTRNIKAMTAKIGVGGILLAMAAVLGLFAFGMLLMAFAHALAIILPLWASFLIVASVLLLVAGIFLPVGIKKLKASGKHVDSVRASLNEDVAAIKNGLKK